MRTPNLPVLALLVWLVAAGALVCAADSGDRDPAKEEPSAKRSPYVEAAEAKRAASDRPTRTFSNEDLQRMFSGGADPEADEGRPSAPARPAPTKPDDTASAEPGKSPLEWMQERQAAQRDRQARIAEAAKAVEQARERIAELEKRRLAVTNPYLARPKAPEEGGEDWDAMGAKERRDRTDQEIEAAREALRKAETELAAARSGTP